MSMRKLKRNIARNRMKAAGVHGFNRQRCDRCGNKHPSYFAEHWREFIGGKAKRKAVSRA